MIDRYDPHRLDAAERVLNATGDTPRPLREAVMARAAHLGGRPIAEPSRDEVPPVLAAYVDKVALNAYKVTDEDVAALRKNGYSEDAVYEITLCAALGAGLGRLERGLSSLHGGAHAPSKR